MLYPWEGAAVAFRWVAPEGDLEESEARVVVG